VEVPILLNAAAIHYTSDTERNEAAELNSQLAEHESALISLPIAQAGRGDAAVFRARYPGLKNHRLILFLSRIHPMKGLELLIDAFARLREKKKDVVLVIAGDGEKAYVRKLRERSRRLQHGARSLERGEEDKEGRKIAELFGRGI